MNNDARDPRRIQSKAGMRGCERSLARAHKSWRGTLIRLPFGAALLLCDPLWRALSTAGRAAARCRSLAPARDAGIGSEVARLQSITYVNAWLAAPHPKLTSRLEGSPMLAGCSVVAQSRNRDHRHRVVNWCGRVAPAAPRARTVLGAAVAGSAACAGRGAAAMANPRCTGQRFL